MIITVSIETGGNIYKHKESTLLYIYVYLPYFMYTHWLFLQFRGIVSVLMMQTMYRCINHV